MFRTRSFGLILTMCRHRVSSGTAYTGFSLATNMSWKDKPTEEYLTRTEWHSIVLWGKFAEWVGSLKMEGEPWYREF